jgi:uncharacterized protein (TIGR04255 family)
MDDAPVFFTIGQVQHNPILSLESYLPTIQESMRKAGYPDFKRGSLISLEFSGAGIGGESQQVASPTPTKVERYAFLDSTQSKAIILHPKSVSFETNTYEVFEAFLPELLNGLTILSETVGGLSYSERIGLRYVNAVAPKHEERVDEYLVPELRGLPANFPNGVFRYSFTESLLEDSANHQVLTRAVIQNSPLSYPADLQLEPVRPQERFSNISGEHATLDIDGFILERRTFDLSDIKLRLKTLHDLNHDCFQASITDYARKAWGYKK